MLRVSILMIARDPAEIADCTGTRSNLEFHLEAGPFPKAPFCPRTIEILTALNEVFDSIDCSGTGIPAATGGA